MEADVLVIGAGLAGLVAAAELADFLGGCIFSKRVAWRTAAQAIA